MEAFSDAPSVLGYFETAPAVTDTLFIIARFDIKSTCFTVKIYTLTGLFAAQAPAGSALPQQPAQQARLFRLLCVFLGQRGVD